MMNYIIPFLTRLVETCLLIAIAVIAANGLQLD